MVLSSTHTGWRRDRENSRLDLYYQGTRIGHINASGFESALTLTSGTGLTVTAGGATITAGGLTVTAGGAVVTAGDIAATAGNYRGGPINAFATTEPTQAVILEAGTAPAGAVTTSSGIFASATVLRKIIAAGTVSDVET